MAAAGEAISELRNNGYDPDDPTNEPRLFDAVIKHLEANEVYQSFIKKGEQGGEPQEAGKVEKEERATEVTATGTTGGRSASGGETDKGKLSEAEERLRKVRAAVYAEGRRKPSPTF